jgi:hypothetical protein
MRASTLPAFAALKLPGHSLGPALDGQGEIYPGRDVQLAEDMA